MCGCDSKCAGQFLRMWLWQCVRVSVAQCEDLCRALCVSVCVFVRVPLGVNGSACACVAGVLAM